MAFTKINFLVKTILFLIQRLLRVLPFLTFGNDSKMAPILDHFADVLDFAKIDFEHGPDDDAKMEAFVAMCNGIERNAIGNTMKSLMIETGVIKKCLNYIVVSLTISFKNSQCRCLILILLLNSGN